MIRDRLLILRTYHELGLLLVGVVLITCVVVPPAQGENTPAKSGALRRSSATGATNFPAFPGVQETYYQSIRTQLLNEGPSGCINPGGTDIRAYYDQFSSDIIVCLRDTGFPKLQPPSGVSPTDPNWQAVQKQLLTELSYVEAANDWLLGPRSTQTLLTQIFVSTTLNANAIAGTLSASGSASVDMDILSLLTKVAGAIAAIGGVPVAPGVGALLLAVFSAVASSGGAPTSLPLAVDKVDGQMSTMYNAALNANNTTHATLVQNWSQLQAFAAPKSGLVPSDADMEKMRGVGESAYTLWLWQTLAPVAWQVITPLHNARVGCMDSNGNFPQEYSYPNSTSPLCGPKWIGKVGFCFPTCGTPPTCSLQALFGTSTCTPNEPPALGVPLADVYLGQNGWKLANYEGSTPPTGR